MALYGSRRQGGHVVCGCACGVGRYGENLIVDFSGIIPCECFEADPTPDAVFQATNISMPTHWELAAISDTSWASPYVGSFDLKQGSECNDLSEFQSGDFRAFVACIPEGESAGLLSIQLQIRRPGGPVGDIPAFAGESDMNIVCSNLAECRTYYYIGQTEFLGLFQDGLALLTRP